MKALYHAYNFFIPWFSNRKKEFVDGFALKFEEKPYSDKGLYTLGICVMFLLISNPSGILLFLNKVMVKFQKVYFLVKKNLKG